MVQRIVRGCVGIWLSFQSIAEEGSAALLLAGQTLSHNPRQRIHLAHSFWGFTPQSPVPIIWGLIWSPLRQSFRVQEYVQAEATYLMAVKEKGRNWGPWISFRGIFLTIYLLQSISRTFLINTWAMDQAFIHRPQAEPSLHGKQDGAGTERAPFTDSQRSSESPRRVTDHRC